MREIYRPGEWVRYVDKSDLLGRLCRVNRMVQTRAGTRVGIVSVDIVGGAPYDRDVYLNTTWVEPTVPTEDELARYMIEELSR
jgi:hypothetical protein